MDDKDKEQKASDAHEPQNDGEKPQYDGEKEEPGTAHSIRSKTSRSTASSSASLAAAKARAKAEAAKAKLEFHEKETSMQIEKAKLEASLRALNLQREVKAACVEAEVLEAAAADIEEEKYSEPSNRSPVAVQTLKRTEDYVKEQSSNFGQYVYKDEKTVLHSYFPVSAPAKLQQYSTSDEFAPLPTQPLDRTGVYSEPPILTPNPYKKEEINDSGMPQTQTAFHGTSMNTGNHTFDLARFLARNQVLTSGLNKFDDTPEHYQAWRASFINAIEPLGLTPSEEVDLMVKWLGKESSVHAARIRAVNVDQPMNGLKAVWSRLDKMYGSPEAIESALFSRVEAFPKVQSRDSHKLQELADLLQELEIAKQNSKLCGLAYLDTARGVQPIVEKLPYPLQERWMSKGSKYKKDYDVPFPPFSFFKEFICTEAEVRNDPSFKLCPLSSPSQRKDKYGAQASSLSKCRSFIKMTLDERKKLLKEKMICYRCCASTSHMAKNCQAPIKCLECASDKHVSAMHNSGTSSVQPSGQPPPCTEDGGEEEIKQEITSSCTKVCGAEGSGKSCSKIVLVNVYPSGQHDKSKTMYAVLDDQSNLSLARSDFFDMFDIHGTEAPYNITTCMGATQAFGRRAYGYVIEQMFHCFVVREDCRDVLRFLWYRDNLPDNEVVEYRMRVHIFGNSPSPAIAIYGLRRAAKELERDYSSHTTELVESHFYMDDALLSFTSETEATETVEQLQEMLAISNLRLHKIASNCVNVINHFPAEDRAKDIKDLDLFADDLPVQRSLGVIWNIMTDTFTFKIPEHTKPFTRRGVLSTVNSLFDPLGFLAPITIKGRMILRDITSDNVEWDAPLPQSKFEEWRRWQESLSVLKDLHIPRTYATFPVTQAKTTELCVFSDASVRAISAVAYLRVTHDDDHHEVGFVLGKAKLAPQPELTIPRLELCAAVLAVEVAETIMQEIHLKVDAVRFFSDSKVVLGYIHNEKRRFYVFVSNRVQRIRQVSQPTQWRFVPTELNPADCGSRSVAAEELVNTLWLTGPRFLTDPDTTRITSSEQYTLVDPDDDTEIRVNAINVDFEISSSKLFSSRFEHFSNWKSLCKAVARLIHIAKSFSDKSTNNCSGWHYCNDVSPSELNKAECFIIRTVQQECYSQELSAIRKEQSLPKTSPILKLNPFMDNDGLLRVGGRLRYSQLQKNEANPVIIPNKHHIAVLLVRYHHERVRHQGRHLTEGAIRASGLWLVGGKRLISAIIHKCVCCRKLRGLFEQQFMSDLPEERLKVDPPFSYVGLDVFGPWEIVTRRMRGGQVNNKRWAVLFTCMSTRAIHIEVVESLSTSSFINALRRFFSLRGPAKKLRSDRGTNFIGAYNELKLLPSDADPSVKDYLNEQRCTWEFNPPHASHMGGAWERMIGVSRRILDGLLLDVKQPQLTHEVLVTLMAEVTAIVNARPLVPISADPDAP
ncbi:hypothetical protein WMY93_023046 [Mugilogobius chulae]|uniref:Integrase catalytic domain-containing protein n=1 Tax=Mugilogobius chulae TaxID=88201 RepID=A0AAW0NDP4_9GOBI